MDEKFDRLGLEELVKLTNKIGLEYVDAKKNAEYYDLMKSSVRAKIAIKLDDGKMSEAKLKRITETDEEYVEFIENLTEARRNADRLKVRYESYKNLFDARRSLLSYQKAELKLI